MEKMITLNLGPVAQIPLGLGKSFVVQGEEIAVFRSHEGRLFAIENICPHKKSPLVDGLMAAHLVACPGHGHKFNLVTGEGSEPGERVKVFVVREANGTVILEYPSVNK